MPHQMQTLYIGVKVTSVVFLYMDYICVALLALAHTFWGVQMLQIATQLTGNEKSFEKN